MPVEELFALFCLAKKWNFILPSFPSAQAELLSADSIIHFIFIKGLWVHFLMTYMIEVWYEYSLVWATDKSGHNIK